MLINGRVLSQAAEIMRTYAKEGLIMFQEPNVVFMKAIDQANVGLVECKFNCDKVPELVSQVAVTYSDIPSDLDQPVVVEIVDKRILIHDGRVNYKINTLVNVRQPPSPKVPYQLIFDVTATELKTGLKAIFNRLDSKDSSQAVKFSWDGSELVVEDSKGEVVDVTYEKSELTIKQDYTSSISVVLPQDYIREIVKSLGYLNVCTIGMGNLMPISIGGSSQDIGCGWLTAHRV